MMVRRLLLAAALSLCLSPLASLAAGVNINTADAAELERVKGIGPAKAKAIVEYRNANGPFARVADLKNVPGIGEKTLEQIRRRLTVKSDEGEGEVAPAR